MYCKVQRDNLELMKIARKQLRSERQLHLWCSATMHLRHRTQDPPSLVGIGALATVRRLRKTVMGKCDVAKWQRDKSKRCVLNIGHSFEFGVLFITI
jgi:hypothetical protein